MRLRPLIHWVPPPFLHSPPRLTHINSLTVTLAGFCTFSYSPILFESRALPPPCRHSGSRSSRKALPPRGVRPTALPRCPKQPSRPVLPTRRLDNTFHLSSFPPSSDLQPPQPHCHLWLMAHFPSLRRQSNHQRTSTRPRHIPTRPAPAHSPPPR